MERVIFHIDFDYFYAQCEEIRRPELRARPVIVCVFSGRGGDSGAVATANYTAREFGVKSGMPIRFAKKRLEGEPGAVFLPVDFDYYSGITQKAMDMMRGYADVFEYVGKDEAYLDVTERTDGDYSAAARLAQRVKNEIRTAVRLTCSVGISPNKLLSKIASDYKKPDGLTIVAPERVTAFLVPLEIRRIPGIGRKTTERLMKMNLRTVGDLLKIDVFALQKEFGRRSGAYIYNAARGMDDDPVAERAPNVQYSKIVTLSEDSTDPRFLDEALRDLCGQLHGVVIKNKRVFRSVGIQFIQSDLSQKTKSRMLRNPTSGLSELERNTMELLHELLRDQKMPVRRLGVKVSELSEIGGQRVMDDYL